MGDGIFVRSPFEGHGFGDDFIPNFGINFPSSHQLIKFGAQSVRHQFCEARNG